MLGCGSLQAQMNYNGQSLYGNEWVDLNKSYIKFTVNEDGIYRIRYDQLTANGFPADVKGSEIQLFTYGEQVMIHVSKEGQFSSGDYIEFFGLKNDGTLDRTLYEDWTTQQLNPNHSMFTDERPYFLTWQVGSNNNARYETISNDLTGNLQAEPFYLHEDKQVFNHFHVSPVINEEQVRYSNFFTTEGFGTMLLQQNTVEFNPTNVAPGNPNSKLFFRYGTNAGNHIVHVEFNDDLLDTRPGNAYVVEQLDFDILTSDIKNNNKLVLKGTASNYDLNSISYALLRYPREFQASNQSEFRFPFPMHGFKKYFEVQGFAAQGGAPVVLDRTNGVRLESSLEGGVVKFALPQALTKRDIIIYSQPKTIDNLKQHFFRNYGNESPDYVILTSRELNKLDVTGTNWINEYGSFRETPLGDSYNVAVVEIEDIRDQFGYGVDQHSIGINNWAMYVRDLWPDWKHVFIIGKGYEYGEIRNDPNLVSYVPTHGEPGADHLMFAERGTTFPIVAVGRYAATSREQIGAYLNKVKVFEDQSVWGQSIEGRSWMKEVVHLSGGDPLIQDILRTWLDDMGEVLEEPKFGANVTTFAKTTSDPIQTSLSQSIIDKINDGTSIITFFGHSAVGTFDFSIEDPSQFDNEGKTPVIFSLGCHSGNIHTTSEGISEKFVLEPEKGAVAFVASSGVAYVNPQYLHGRYAYDLLGDDFYGRPIGEILRESMIQNTNNNNFQVSTLQQQLTLHGDPALVINPLPGPDFVPDFSTFRTVPEVVSGRLDSIDICFDIVNIGSAITDTMNYYLVHSNISTQDTFYFSASTPWNREEVCATIPIDMISAIGKNVIDVFIDYDNTIKEEPGPDAEANNTLKDAYQIEGFCFFALSNNPIPFYPYEFAITNEEDLTLLSSTGNAFVDPGDYEIEIDTTELFNSPLKQAASVSANGGLVSWQPNVQYLENQVYYWRVKAANSEVETDWNYSSFIHIDQYESGWNQSHLYQYLKDDFKTLGIDSTTRNFNYSNSTFEYRINNTIWEVGVNDHEYFLNQERLGGFFPTNEFPSGIYFFVIDPISGEHLPCPANGPFGSDPQPSILPADGFRAVWQFRTDSPEERAEVVNFVSNEIPDDYYVIMTTVQSLYNDYKPGEWEEELFQVFESKGSTLIRSLVNNTVQYSLAWQQGGEVLKEEIGIAGERKLDIFYPINVRWFEGDMYSTVIGPAAKWNKFLWNLEGFEANEDIYNISITGIQGNGTEDVLVQSVNSQEFDLSPVNPNVYPYLKLELFSRDTISHTSFDLDYWRVVYEPLPEAVLNTQDQFSFHADTIKRGEKLNLTYTIDNVSSTNMDSMLVHYTIIDNENNEIFESKRKSPLQASASIGDSFEKETTDLNGPYKLRVEINPDKDQPEQYDFNNLGILSFYVAGDNVNPLLDVTFDGVRILDGDIVSSEPFIKVVLSDINSNLLLENIDDFQLTLLSPGQTDPVEIDLNSPEVNFIPASDVNDNQACLEFSPTFIEGEYTLFIQGKDASGNFSGDQKFSISFKVYEEDMISNVLNYPNPFSTQTEFIFTLTGSQVPQNYHIKIMTVSGKVVREITQEELGPIHIGVNRSEYKWDGRDEYGSRLANGVYIYKFYTDIDSDLDAFSLGDADDFFKKGFGKLVIMR